MTGEVVAPVKAGQDYVVVAWPIQKDGRKEISGTALYDAAGRLMARSLQVWISMGPRGPMPAPAAETTGA